MKKDKKKNTNNLVMTQKHPMWIDTEIGSDVFDDDFLQIILFYVFYSPCPRCSTQNRTLQHYHWNGTPWRTNRYLKDKLNLGVFQDKKYFGAASKVDELPKMLQKTGLSGDSFYEQRECERVAFLNCEGSEYISLFHHIRCALAHGRIAMFRSDEHQNIMFVMENGCEVGNFFQVKARMILRKSTLLRWIKIITDGPQEPEKDYRYEVFRALTQNPYLRKKQLMAMLNETQYVVDKAINYLTKENLIVFHNHGKKSWWEIHEENAEKFFLKG